ncbi:MAG: aminopeptidase P family protein [Mesorhizobium sp.]|nr:MAG: aminopeptidase P family protein [Mesorhizobium sp.]
MTISRLDLIETDGTTGTREEARTRIHFEAQEFEQRRRRACERILEERLDGLLIFRQESMYYLTGFDRMGYLSFQVLYLGADGRLTLLTRPPDAIQARQTSTIEDIRTWIDRDGVNPALAIRDMLDSHRLQCKRLGVEYDAVGLSARRGQMLDEALDGFCTLVDASELIARIRLLKSPAEQAYIRKSAALTQAALADAIRLSLPGRSLGEIYAAMYATIMAGGGDVPPSGRWPMGCRESAQLVRYFTGSPELRIGLNDQVTNEFGAGYRHYHTAAMFVALTGKVDPRHRQMFSACCEAVEASQAAARPGKTMGEIYDAYARVLTHAGFAGKFLAACGYHIGIAYPPSWVEEPMIYEGNPLVLEPGMVLFMHMIMQDEDAALAMSLGETVIVTSKGCERLTRVPRELVIN